MIELNTIYNEDCIGPNGMCTIPDKSIDMILCDLPYGTTACKWDAVIPFEPLWKQYERIIKLHGAIVLIATQPFTSALVTSNVKHFKHSWIWNKVTARGHLVAKYRPMQQTEDILVFAEGKVNYYPIMIDRPKNKIKVMKTREYKRTEIMGGTQSHLEPKVYDKWYPKNLITISNAFSSIKSTHPTQKPVALFEYLIKTYTNEEEIVLDNCMGSGTTAIACINTNRQYIGFELDKHYFEAANERIKNHSRELRI